VDYRPAKILFILKYREGYGLSREEASSGLLNSARFIADMLASHGVEVKLVQVTDNNDIDREVSQYRPTHAVIEAFWVVPEKFEVLRKLHPTVQWVVRAHSELPFFANEGVAMGWLVRYSRQPNVIIAANSEPALRDFRAVVRAANPSWTRDGTEKSVVFLPNFYPVRERRQAVERFGTIAAIHVGCFGAIRPLKNHLLQAAAALQFAEEEKKFLHFHVNGSRTEQGGDNPLKNLRDLFAAAPSVAELVEHPWMAYQEFLGVLPQIDIGMQVAFTETFNIVTADMVCAGVPVVVSPEIRWCSRLSQAQATDSRSMVRAMRRVTGPLGGLARWLNLRGLRRYARRSERVWLEYFLTPKSKLQTP